MKVLPEKEFIRALVERSLSEGCTREEAVEEVLNLRAAHLIPEGEILVKKGSTLGIRLHEVGHKTLGHTDRYSVIETGARTIGDEILDEILAEKFSYDSRGKRPNYRLVLPAIGMLVTLHYSWSPEKAVFWTLYILKKELGIVPTKSERRDLARYARGLSIEKGRKR